VAELEDENQLFHASAGIPPAEPTTFVPPISKLQLEEDG